MGVMGIIKRNIQMRKIIQLFILILLSLTLLTAQTDKDVRITPDDKDADIWLNAIWDNIDTMSVGEKAFEVEKVTTVAGVRGKEAESDILKHLYIRKNSNISSQEKVEEAVHRLLTALKKRPKDSRVPEWEHYLIQCYLHQGKNKEAEKLKIELGRDYPKSKWAKLYTEKIP